MKVKYEKLSSPKGNIFVRRFKEEVVFDDLTSSWEYLIDKNKLDDSVIGVINDLSCCELKLNKTSFKKLLSFLKDNPKLKNLPLAVYTLDPKNIVFPVMGSEETDLKIKPFSTMEAAVDWIIKQKE